MKKLSLKGEEICGYYVSPKMKKVWMIELELLEKFINVCDKYNFKYFLISGSLIGAIRHEGFIPWDDDIDIGMLREDYNKLLKVAEKEFKNPIFFQTPYNDKLYRGHAQIRNSNTSAILPSEVKYDYNQGIFIDVFPFDEFPKGKMRRAKQRIQCKILERVMVNYMIPEHKSVKSKLMYLVLKPLIDAVGYTKIYSYYEKVCSKYNGKGNGYVSNNAFIYGRERYSHKKEYFYELINHKFENLNVKIPKNYDTILKKQYGNYKKYVVGTSVHGNLYLDPDISYKDYLKKIRNGEK